MYFSNDVYVLTHSPDICTSLIIRIEDAGKVESFLRAHLNEFHIRRIVMTAEDRKLLNASGLKIGKELNLRK